jgi:hypothetical protein
MRGQLGGCLRSQRAHDQNVLLRSARARREYCSGRCIRAMETTPAASLKADEEAAVAQTTGTLALLVDV